MKNQVQLITYVDRLTNGTFADLQTMLDGPMAGLFSTVHALPFFDPYDGVDAGFDPKDHTIVDPRLGTWKDVQRLATSIDITADLIVNHVSADSDAFQDFVKNGDASDFASMFLTYDTVFPDGATEADLMAIYRPRPGLPFTYIPIKDGTTRLMWTTFAPQQIDIDVNSEKGAAYLDEILHTFAKSGVSCIRLDAAGYAIKTPRTSCFMTPETFEFLDQLAIKAKQLGMEVLVEIHSYYQDQIEISKQVDRVYDFALPPLVLHALFTADAKPLADWLKIAPRNALTVLDTHDGIGVIDVGAHSDGRPGLLKPEAVDQLVETIHERTNGQSRKATGAAASNLDLYQVNATYFSALGCRETDYLIARAAQFFAPGIPQVYYAGLLGAANDMELLEKTNVGRDINRPYFKDDEVRTALQKPMVAALAKLIRFRNTHPAFQGAFSLEQPSETKLDLTWRTAESWATLCVDFAGPSAHIRHTTNAGEDKFDIKP